MYLGGESMQVGGAVMYLGGESMQVGGAVMYLGGESMQVGGAVGSGINGGRPSLCDEWVE
jgi:hypothetical protein